MRHHLVTSDFAALRSDPLVSTEYAKQQPTVCGLQLLQIALRPHVLQRSSSLPEKLSERLNVWKRGNSGCDPRLYKASSLVERESTWGMPQHGGMTATSHAI